MILIGGKQKSGKDTVFHIYEHIMKSKFDMEIKRTDIGEITKRFMSSFFGRSEDDWKYFNQQSSKNQKLPHSNIFVRDIIDKSYDFFRGVYKNFYIFALQQRYHEYILSNPLTAVNSDIRELYDLDMLNDIYDNIITIRVERPRKVSKDEAFYNVDIGLYYMYKIDNAWHFTRNKIQNLSEYYIPITSRTIDCETSLDQYLLDGKFDYILINDGSIEQLTHKVECIIDDIVNKYNKI